MFIIIHLAAHLAFKFCKRKLMRRYEYFLIEAAIKPISAHDQKTLDTAIALANEITTRSMSAPAPSTPASPNKKKFSFRFPSVTDSDKHVEKRNFSEEALSTSDLQKFINSSSSQDEIFPKHLRLPLWDKASAEFYFAKSRELLSRPFPLSNNVPHSSCKNLSNNENNLVHDNLGFEGHFENLPFDDDTPRRSRFNFLDRSLTKSENMIRKTYYPRIINERNRGFTHNNVHEPINPNSNDSHFIETSYIYYKSNNVITNNFEEIKSAKRHNIHMDEFRPRTLSYSDTTQDINFPRRNGRSIRDRNRRRQSYNPRAYETSSSDSDCISVGSVDLDWRRRRRLSRNSGSNSSIRSEMIKKSTNPFLKPNFSIKMMGRSPPPSNNILSGLSPTSVSRCQQPTSNSFSSDSSL
ncbi:hypothetical protein HHI36_004793 [Cryptolaemus montrouzieri]|uniref:Uncharacterized protein n=1 Tax=Cryptolaemus montrouzieri TaxID=559131 RepID=A0ABD2NS95_9CUCU